MTHPALNTPSTAPIGTDVERWLLGQPTLSAYLEFVRTFVVGGADLDPVPVAADWRAAQAEYLQRETSESGLADRTTVRALPRALRARAAALAELPMFRRTYAPLETSFGMVDLTTVIACQHSVTWSYVETLAATLPAAPDPAALVAITLPEHARPAQVQARDLGDNRYVFRTPSTDFRFHEATLLTPDQLGTYQSFGPTAAAVGLVVGFGSNLLTVLQVGRRLLLHNGYHRACALMARGITRVPAVIVRTDTQDDLDLIAKPTVRENPDFFFRSHRPPLLRDFLNPALSGSLVTHRLERVVEVRYEVKEYLVPA